MFKHIVFDWGDTLMRDYPGTPGPMADWAHVENFPRVESVLAELQKRYVLSVASNAGESDTADMCRALQRTDLLKYFTHQFTSKELGVSKPDPIFFTEICRRAGFKPDESIMVGNDYNKDILSAHLIGMKTVFFNHAYLNGSFENATHIIEDLATLLELL